MGKLYQGLKKRDCFSNRKQLFTTVKLVSLIQLYVQFVWKFVPEDVELIPEVLRQDDGEEEDDEGDQGEEVAHVLHDSNPGNEINHFVKKIKRIQITLVNPY